MHTLTQCTHACSVGLTSVMCIYMCGTIWFTMVHDGAKVKSLFIGVRQPTMKTYMGMLSVKKKLQ